MTSAPTTQPMISATCCRQGVACTSQPVFRSCRLSLETEATATTAVPEKRVRATMNWRLASSANMLEDSPISSSTSETMTTEMMPMPEMGLDDEPTRPAM